VLKVDRFGNLITNYHVEEFPELERRSFVFGVGPQQVGVLARNYSESSPGEVFAIVGSAGYYEISVREASAARATGCGAGSPVELTIY
jgi:S-adenosylmethionine hydrolase